MTKPGKGLTLVGGGVPAAAILSVCVMNANPPTPQSHLAADTIGTPKSSEAMVQPKPMESSTTGTAPAPDALSDLARHAKPLGKATTHDTAGDAKTHPKAHRTTASTQTQTEAQRKVAAKVVAYAKSLVCGMIVLSGGLWPVPPLAV
jgi:hypothetical protein